jgi:hypothetical protein
MPGLSPDPSKRARQLAGLAQSNSLLAARLQAADEPAATPAPAAPPPALAGGDGAPGTVAGLPVRHADHQEPPRAQDPQPEPDDPGSAGLEPGGGAPDPADEPDLERGPELDDEPAGGWRGFLQGALGG